VKSGRVELNARIRQESEERPRRAATCVPNARLKPMCKSVKKRSRFRAARWDGTALALHDLKSCYTGRKEEYRCIARKDLAAPVR